MGLLSKSPLSTALDSDQRSLAATLKLLRLILPRRLMKRRQQFVVLRVLPIAILRVPLHAQRKRLGANHADRLDLPIITNRLNLQAFTQPINPLPVQRINLHFTVANDLVQQAT